MEPVARRELAFVQGLRGLAALAVMLFHARHFLDGPAHLDAGPRLFGSGAAGVDLFFVISGFVMAHTAWHLEAGAGTAARFAVRRVARIWPVYAAAYLAVWLATRAAGGDEFATTAADAARALAFVPRNPDGVAPYFGAPLLDGGWTLNYEVWFYALFALALLVPRRLRGATIAAQLAICLVVVTLIAAGRVQLDGQASYGLASYACVVTSPVLWEFAIGIAIAHLYRARFAIRDRAVCDCLVAVTAALMVWQLADGVRRGHGPVHWGLSTAALVAALALRDKVAPVVVPRWLTWLGDVSFSLYLFHRLPQLAVRLYLPSHAHGGGAFFACIVAGLVLAYAGHRWLERGLAERVRRALLAAMARPPSAAAVQPA